MALVMGDNIVIYSLIDHDTIIKYKWWDQKGYARAVINGKKIFMHRLIMNCYDEKIVDHINGNKLDNRRENLRITTTTKNAQNKRKKDGLTSKYIGVRFVSNRNNYRANIKINGIQTDLGSYKTEKEAAEARDMYIVHELPDSLYNLNFPDKKQVYLQTKYKKRAAIVKKPKPAIDENKTEYECTNIEEIIRILIPNKPDAHVKIDTEDYENVRHLRWHINTGGYVANSENGLLHRLIMDVTDTKVLIDHINGNKLDNTKDNLRLANSETNAQNVTKKEGSSSKYLGVSKQKNTTNKIWRASMRKNGKDITIGSFETEELAAKARDSYILNNFPGTYYKLNFPN